MSPEAREEKGFTWELEHMQHDPQLVGVAFQQFVQFQGICCIQCDSDHSINPPPRKSAAVGITYLGPMSLEEDRGKQKVPKNLLAAMGIGVSQSGGG